MAQKTAYNFSKATVDYILDASLAFRTEGKTQSDLADHLNKEGIFHPLGQWTQSRVSNFFVSHKYDWKRGKSRKSRKKGKEKEKQLLQGDANAETLSELLQVVFNSPQSASSKVKYAKLLLDVQS